MLENTVWRQYHQENNLRQKVSEFCKIDADDILLDDKELYAVVKSKLTKKELKLFAMDTAGVPEEEIKTEMSLNDEELQNTKFKLYKKLKQDKMRSSFQGSSLDTED
jgi:hypothetical protein